ncbi:MBL fold metallo-hydrolase [Paenibacillus flagellatus]|uniref:MBL fold metallo-hydrolase n=1 Tax=Paenibacillus flagellatus TaxID=2211139 RepID=A0A2V5K537_9BACL|nr:MBL fold metallo-hydrolase [Paenibacillus flagellatus]PYI54475.1 MBL fold metallo-hydrolase [Paenibacillus flagellatus]
MRIDIQMIGTGSAFAKNYYNNNALVACNGYKLMIDFGITAPLAMHRLGLPLDVIDGVFITHLHADHIGGFEELMLRLRFHYGKKPQLFIEGRLIEPFWEYSLRGGLEFGAEERQTLDQFFDVVPLSVGKPHEIVPGFRMEILPTKHFRDMPSYCVILNDELFYSGDTVFDPELIRSVHERNCTYLLHDCQLDGHGLVHATLQELLTLPESIQQKIWLMHYGDNMESYIGKTGPMKFLLQHETYSFPVSAPATAD